MDVPQPPFSKTSASVSTFVRVDLVMSLRNLNWSRERQPSLGAVRKTYLNPRSVMVSLTETGTT